MDAYFPSLLETVPVWKEIPAFHATGEWEDIRAITYDGACIGTKPTKVFAYIGYPENMTEKVPAVVLVHGGGGVPYLTWVKMWNARGYAAIAFSTTNDFPLTVNAGITEDGSKKEEWGRGLFGAFAEEGYVDAPACDEMRNYEKPLDEQWMYHAVSSVILAHNILRADPHIDPLRIGITGVSWGGVITSLAIGYDTRFAFAVPIYGAGHLAESLGDMNLLFDPAFNRANWLAEDRFDRVKFPVLWMCYNKDTGFSPTIHSMSYLDTVKNNADCRLAMIHKMGHAHTCAWKRYEPFAFADSVCRGGKRLPTVVWDGDRPRIDDPDGVEITACKLFWLDAPMTYAGTEKDPISRLVQEWQITELSDISDPLPAQAVDCYYEITCRMGEDEYATTSPLFRI